MGKGTGSALACAAGIAVLAAGCGSGQKDTEKPRTDLKPLSEVSALEMIESVVKESKMTSVRKQEIFIVGHGPWKIDLWIEEIPLVIEYLTEEDRAKLGKSLSSSKVGDHFKLVAIATEPIAEGQQLTSANSRYCVVFDDADYVYQPNPTSEDRYDVTIFEIEKRMRKDAVDVIEELGRVLSNMASEEQVGESESQPQ